MGYVIGVVVVAGTVVCTGLVAEVLFVYDVGMVLTIS